MGTACSALSVNEAAQDGRICLWYWTPHWLENSKHTNAELRTSHPIPLTQQGGCELLGRGPLGQRAPRFPLLRVCRCLQLPLRLAQQLLQLYGASVDCQALAAYVCCLLVLSQLERRSGSPVVALLGRLTGIDQHCYQRCLQPDRCMHAASRHQAPSNWCHVAGWPGGCLRAHSCSSPAADAPAPCCCGAQIAAVAACCPFPGPWCTYQWPPLGRTSSLAAGLSSGRRCPAPALHPGTAKEEI